MTSNYINFSEEQKEQARNTLLSEFLQRQGMELKRAGKAYEWINGGEKITVYNNLWYNHYRQEGGDAIDFVCRYYQCRYPEAVMLLLGSDAASLPAEEKAVRKPVKKELTVPRANKDMRRVFAYLTKERGIGRDVVERFVKEGLLYEDAEHHNCVFVGRDEEGNIRHIHMRGSGSESSFKLTAEGSDPVYSFHTIGASGRLYVFEAPVDLLSFLTLYPDAERQHSYAALCSVSSLEVMRLLESRPDFCEIVLCLDSDGAGCKACQRIARQIREKYPDKKLYRVAPQNKDFNEDLKQLRYKRSEEKEECPVLQS